MNANSALTDSFQIEKSIWFHFLFEKMCIKSSPGGTGSIFLISPLGVEVKNLFRHHFNLEEKQKCLLLSPGKSCATSSC